MPHPRRVFCLAWVGAGEAAGGFTRTGAVGIGDGDLPLACRAFWRVDEQLEADDRKSELGIGALAASLEAC